MSGPFHARPQFRPYFTLTGEALRQQRSERHRTWCEEDYQSTRRMLRYGMYCCIGIVVAVLVVIAWAHR